MELIVSPTYYLGNMIVFFHAMIRHAFPLYVKIQGKKIYLSDQTSTSKRQITRDVCDNFLYELDFSSEVDAQYLDLFFIYGLYFRHTELIELICDVHSMKNILEIINRVSNQWEFDDSSINFIHKMLQNNSQEFIDHLCENEKIFFGIVIDLFDKKYSQISSVFFEKQIIPIPETIFLSEKTYESQYVFDIVLSCYLTQTLGIPIADLNSQNCYSETNRLMDAYTTIMSSQLDRCGLSLIRYGLDARMWYNLPWSNHVKEFGSGTFAEFISWIKNAPQYDGYLILENFFSNLNNTSFTCYNVTISHITEVFTHLTISGDMGIIVDAIHEFMFYSGKHLCESVLCSRDPWELYQTIEFYYRNHLKDFSTQELLRNRILYTEPDEDRNSDIVNIVVNISDTNRFTDLFDRDPYDIMSMTRFEKIHLTFVIRDTKITFKHAGHSKEILDRDTIDKVEYELQNGMLQSAKNILLATAVHHNEVKLVESLLKYDADPRIFQLYPRKIKARASPDITELLMNHCFVTFGDYHNDSYRYLLDILSKFDNFDNYEVIRDTLLKNSIDWKDVAHLLVIYTFTLGTLDPVFQEYYVSDSCIPLTSFLLEVFLDPKIRITYPFIIISRCIQLLIRWDLHFFPNMTINDLVTTKHLDLIVDNCLEISYTTLLMLDLDPRHSEDRVWKRACAAKQFVFIQKLMDNGEIINKCYVPRSETIGENDNWAFKTFFGLRDGNRIPKPIIPAYLKNFLSFNISTLDVDTVSYVASEVSEYMKDPDISINSKMDNYTNMISIYEILERYAETHYPNFSFTRPMYLFLH